MTPRHHRGTGRASRSGADGSDDLDGPDAYTAVSLTLAHVCAINAGSQVACWGTDYHLESGQATPDASSSLTLNPNLVSGLSSCTKVATGLASSCALCGGSVSCWGDVSRGRLGRGIDAYNSDAGAKVVVVPSNKTWTDLGAGDAYGCAVASDGTLACWGLGVRGEIGDGSHGSSVPVPIAMP